MSSERQLVSLLNSPGEEKGKKGWLVGGAAECAASFCLVCSRNLLPLCSRWTLISKADRPFPSGNQPINAAVLLVRPRRTRNTLALAVIISRQKEGGKNYHLERIRFPSSSACTLLLLSFHFLFNGSPSTRCQRPLIRHWEFDSPRFVRSDHFLYHVQRPEKQIKAAGCPSGRSEPSGSLARLCYAPSHQWKQNKVKDKNVCALVQSRERSSDGAQRCMPSSIICLMDFLKGSWEKNFWGTCQLPVVFEFQEQIIVFYFAIQVWSQRGKFTANSKVMNFKQGRWRQQQIIVILLFFKNWKTTQLIASFASELDIQ